MMRPCVMLSSPEEAVFNIGFIAAWKRIVEKFGTIRLSPKCNACTMREVCQTCAACAKLETGSYGDMPGYMCQYTEQTLKLMKEALAGKQTIENNE